MERIKLLKSQTELILLIKNEFVRKMNNTINQVATEQGIKENEISQWELDDNAEYFEKREIKKTPGKK